MIIAVECDMYDLLSAAELQAVRDAISNRDTAALSTQLAAGQLVHVRDADRHPPVGERHRCPRCGNELTPCLRRGDRARYFRHLTVPTCFGYQEGLKWVPVASTA